MNPAQQIFCCSKRFSRRQAKIESLGKYKFSVCIESFIHARYTILGLYEKQLNISITYSNDPVCLLEMYEIFFGTIGMNTEQKKCDSMHFKRFLWILLNYLFKKANQHLAEETVLPRNQVY